MATLSSSVAPSQQVTPSATQEEEEEEQFVLLGSFQASIVGIRYYAGTAHPGEYVQLLREPENQYDGNAIRVDNMANVKVGHIKRQVAVALAPVMDQLKVKIDGTIPYHGNEYTMPVVIEIFGNGRADQVQVDQIFKRHRNRWNMNKKLGQVTPTKAAARVQVSTKTMDWQSAQKNLDEMFEKLSKDQLSNLPDIPMPEALVQELFDHQVQGIRWLYQRETGNQQIPFYKKITENGKEVWFSEITNSSQTTAPQPVKGSILADDMGLGKTLQSIGLMLANPPKQDAKNKTTLILCPVSVMLNWFQQIEQHILPDTLKVAMYHGPDRYDLLSKLDEIDVLVASYGTISTDYGNEFPKEGKIIKPTKKKRKKVSSSSVFQQVFHRIILDEAHIIRNTKSRTFNGCAKLKATYRLCLTGTPLQNKPDDIHSLFHFLSVEPLNDKDIFRRAVSQPIQNGDDVGLGRLRTMMAHIALRRNKGTANLKMANKTVELRAIEFVEGSQHKAIHDAIFKSAQIAFQATLGAGEDKALKNYMMILETLTRIRQACVSGVLVPKARMEAAEKVLAEVEGIKDALTPEEGEALLQKLKGAFNDTEAVECAVCLNEMEENAAVILKTCSHVFCEPCLSKVATTCRGLCPLCRQKFEPEDMIQKSAAAAALTAPDNAMVPLSQCMDELGPSPKLEALLQAMTEMKEVEKAVLFSQFTKFLDVVEPFLTSHGYSFVRIDGSKTAVQRIAAMKAFKEDSGPRIILCSLHAAGTGITLNRANHCFMMDTWWNRSVENQAQDRIHRIGQTRDVRVIRFVMKNSIEERMIALQEAKAAIGKGAMEKLKPEEIRKTRIGDLKSLFPSKKRRNEPSTTACMKRYENHSRICKSKRDTNIT